MMEKKIATISADGVVDLEILGHWFEVFDRDAQITFVKKEAQDPEDFWYMVEIKAGPPGYSASSLLFDIDLSKLFQLIPNCVLDDLMEKRKAGEPTTVVKREHGDLIDQLDLMKALKDKWSADDMSAFALMNEIYVWFSKIVVDAPVVIKSNKEA